VHRSLPLVGALAALLAGCEPESACVAGAVPASIDGETLRADTTDAADHAVSSCGGRGTGDWVGRFTAPSTGFYRVSTDHPGTSYDTLLSLFWDCEDPLGSQLVCLGAANGGGESQDVFLSAGQTLFVAVDGRGETGRFELSIDDDQGLAIDNTEVRVQPPAGVAVAFRATTPNGGPVPPLTDDDVVVINDETGRPFGASAEGQAARYLGRNDAVQAYSILALDFSGSIFAGGGVDDVVAGAEAYIDATLDAAAGGLPHKLAILAFGAPDRLELMSPFTDDRAALSAALDAARAGGDRGTTDLYGAYIRAVQEIDAQGVAGALVERFVVLMTDGTHEAGDTDRLRSIALTEQRGSDATIFTVGIDGDYNPEALRQLASRDSLYFQVQESAGLVDAFERAADRTLALARSNYVVGICTPVALGSPTLTLEITSWNDVDSVTLAYPTAELTGELGGCEPREVAEGAFRRPGGPEIWIEPYAAEADR
jgi:hypothetical protein